ncbi:MAG TPA: hypothetical protein VF384_08635 [Planctomycetota bacterium]
MSDAATNAGGAPVGLLIEGILDGRTAAAEPLLAASAALSACGAGSFRCEITGGRFTLMPRETRVPAAAFDEAAQTRFLEALHGVVAAAAPGSVESNLRCRLIYGQEVAETLFVVRGPRIEPVTRRRPRSPADGDVVATPAAAPAFGLRRRDLVVIAPLLLLAGVLVLWQTGWIDRVLAARAESLAIDTGPFGSMLAAKIERSWGNYVVELRRGPEYPATPRQLQERRDRLEGLTERAACEAIGNGGDLFVQVLDATGNVLAETRVELRLLLGDEQGVVAARLPGLIGAARVRLSMSALPKRR